MPRDEWHGPCLSAGHTSETQTDLGRKGETMKATFSAASFVTVVFAVASFAACRAMGRRASPTRATVRLLSQLRLRLSQLNVRRGRAARLCRSDGCSGAGELLELAGGDQRPGGLFAVSAKPAENDGHLFLHAAGQPRRPGGGDAHSDSVASNTSPWQKNQPRRV